MKHPQNRALVALKLWLGAIALLIALFIPLLVYASTPVVVKSHLEGGRCLRVESMDAAHSCANLPARYEIVWSY